VSLHTRKGGGAIFGVGALLMLSEKKKKEKKRGGFTVRTDGESRYQKKKREKGLRPKSTLRSSVEKENGKKKKAKKTTVDLGKESKEKVTVSHFFRTSKKEEKRHKFHCRGGGERETRPGVIKKGSRRQRSRLEGDRGWFPAVYAHYFLRGGKEKKKGM